MESHQQRMEERKGKRGSTTVNRNETRRCVKDTSSTLNRRLGHFISSFYFVINILLQPKIESLFMQC